MMALTSYFLKFLVFVVSDLIINNDGFDKLLLKVSCVCCDGFDKLLLKDLNH